MDWREQNLDPSLICICKFQTLCKMSIVFEGVRSGQRCIPEARKPDLQTSLESFWAISYWDPSGTYICGCEFLVTGVTGRAGVFEWVCVSVHQVGGPWSLPCDTFEKTMKEELKQTCSTQDEVGLRRSFLGVSQHRGRTAWSKALTLSLLKQQQEAHNRAATWMVLIRVCQTWTECSQSTSLNVLMSTGLIDPP